MLAELAATTILAVVLSSGAPVAVSSPERSCADYTFVGARGSGEGDATTDPNRQGLGAPLFATFAEFSHDVGEVGKSASAVAIDYPAVAVGNTTQGVLNAIVKAGHFGGEYDHSVSEGVEDTISRLKQIQTDCPSTRIILGGYSQGAEVIGDALQKLSSHDKRGISAAVFFGDPKFNADDTEADLGGYAPDRYGIFAPRVPWAKLVDAPVFSYCHSGDPICGISGKTAVPLPGADTLDLYHRDLGYLLSYDAQNRLHLFDPHEDYAPQDSEDAVARVEHVLGLSIPPDECFGPSDAAFVRASIPSAGVAGSVGSAGAPIAPAARNGLVTGLLSALATGGAPFAALTGALAGVLAGRIAAADGPHGGEAGAPASPAALAPDTPEAPSGTPAGCAAPGVYSA